MLFYTTGLAAILDLNQTRARFYDLRSFLSNADSTRAHSVVIIITFFLYFFFFFFCFFLIYSGID